MQSLWWTTVKYAAVVAPNTKEFIGFEYATFLYEACRQCGNTVSTNATIPP